MTAIAKREQAEIAEARPVTVLDIVAQLARGGNAPANIDTIERLMALRERETAQVREQAFNAAMTLAQSEMRPVAADANNPQTRSKYASYLALDRAMRPIYTQHGFGLSFNTEPATSPDFIRVICDVSHRDGHTRRYQVDMPADGKGAKGGDVMTKTHAVGAAMTYGQRYLLKMIFNIAIGEDDDGNRNGGGETITPEQVETLQAAINEVGADVAAFRKFFKIETLPELPAARYTEAVQMLERKRAKK